MRFLKAFGYFLGTSIIFYLLNNSFGSLPPIGKFLDPFQGFWHSAERATAESSEIKLTALKSNVTILFDNHRIPHIFADNEYDLYFAQGYITARDRLWQMDFQTRFAAGRLSEVVGEKALELDKYQRRIGMTYGAERMVEALEKSPQTKAIVQAYAEGVNSYIRSLRPEDYPIEFKILNYKPEEWSPVKTGLLLKMMSSILAGGSDELYMSNILDEYGMDVAENLFPSHAFRTDPIIPAGTKWNFSPLKIPAAPVAKEGNPIADFSTRQRDEGIGSNNWAISGSRSKTGFPILANDPHLDLSLPAIWYQIQMSAPGMNVYGVSIPGAPCVIIGFNQKVAWGVTNVGADVLDWYQVKLQSPEKLAYRYRNRWNPTKRRIEKIQVRGEKTVFDTVFYTHHGPIVYHQNQKPSKFSKARNVPVGNALKWVAHNPSNEIKTFYLLNRAKNYNDYCQAISTYVAPAQNFVFASAENDIAITSSGYFPLKWKNQGKYILDGSKSENDWHGRIPPEQNPTVRNPSRGFVSSANQFPTDSTYPYYINWEFAGYERGHRINTRLAAISKGTPASVMAIQNDNYSVLAQNILPVLTTSIDMTGLSATERQAFRIVKSWNKYYHAAEIGASIFDIWHKELFDEIWKDEFENEKKPMRQPSRDRTVEMILNEKDAKWFDNIHTKRRETRDFLILASFKKSVDSLQQRFGPPGKNWQWAKLKGTHVPHLAAIPGLGSPILHIGGAKPAVNSLGEKNGPSWKMVVSLGKEPKAFGIFPGGQSGNPGSFYYDDQIKTWSSGKLDELIFLKTPYDRNTGIKTKLNLIK